jgi:transcription factor E
MNVEVLLANAVFSDFISKNVGKKAINIIRMLHVPQTDEKLAADLSIKINEVRRILNVLDSYGVARYDTNKDSKGWLTFKWYLNHDRLMSLNTDIMTRKPEWAYRLPEDCNDFFYCNKCYDEQKVIMPFDSAYENQFKCDNCGKGLKQLTRTEAQNMFNESMEEQEKNTEIE